MDVLVLLILLLIHNGLLDSLEKPSTACQRCGRLAAARKQKAIHLEAGCDGGVLVVRRLGVADEVIPACEHLPGEGELAFVSIAATNIRVLGHPADSSDALLANQRDFQSETGG